VYQRGLNVSGVEYVEAIAAAHAAGRKMGTFLHREIDPGREDRSRKAKASPTMITRVQP
jgi:hypothetical protein